MAKNNKVVVCISNNNIKCGKIALLVKKEEIENFYLSDIIDKIYTESSDPNNCDLTELVKLLPFECIILQQDEFINIVI